MARLRATAAAGLLALCSAFNDVIELDLYRALKRLDVKNEIANDDMSDLVGTLQYLHTKVIVEHSDVDMEKKKGEAGEERMSRLNSIDTIVKVRTRVKNPAILVGGHFATQVDFGPAVQFVDGEATGSVYKWDYGDFVGAKRMINERYESDEPAFWFSFSGFCPNLHFAMKLNINRTAPNEQCVWYKDGSRPLDGGLCINGTHPGVQPNGLPGCVYTYEPPTGNRIVSLDEVVGITREDCQGRPCKDWLDFRSTCTNAEYKKMFQYSRRRRYRGPKTQKTDFCVEYDIHPDCAKDCNDKLCKQVPAKDREIGLPFWKGRCDKQANRLRAEQVANIFGIPGAKDMHETVDQELRERGATCVSQYRTECQPAPDFGGMYCTRQWGGVCQPCFIPGTWRPYEKATTTPYCPWDILRSKDYESLPKGRCATDLPSEICCIFMNSCNGTMSNDPTAAPTTADGYQLVASTKSTEGMNTFLTRVVTEGLNGTVTDEDGLKAFAYNQWGPAPLRGRSFSQILRDMAPYIQLPETTLPPVEESKTTTTTDTPPPTTTLAPVETGSAGIPIWVWLTVGGGVLACCILAAVLFMCFGGDDDRGTKKKTSKSSSKPKGKGKEKKKKKKKTGNVSESESDSESDSGTDGDHLAVGTAREASVPLMSSAARSSAAAISPTVVTPVPLVPLVMSPSQRALPQLPVGKAVQAAPASPSYYMASAPARVMTRAP